jgi:hypothetical protein
VPQVSASSNIIKGISSIRKVSLINVEGNGMVGLKGFGGCPMASDKLTGNMPTENLYSWINNNDSVYWLDANYFGESMAVANEIFTKYH